MQKPIKSYLIIAAGVALLAAGLCLIKMIPDPQGVLKVLPYVCIGLGCGLFGNGVGNAVSRRVLKNSPELVRQIEIEQNDERNRFISSHSKAKAFDLMTFVFGALMVCFALMQVDLAAVLLLVAAYLFVEGYAIYCRFQLEKKM